MFGTDDQCYQPVQLYHLAKDGVTCDLIPVSSHLRSAIYYYWRLSIAADEVLLPVIPDGALDLVLSPDIADFAAIYSPQPAPFDIPLHGPIVYVGACFRAEMTSRLFDHSPAELEALEAGLGVVDALQLQPLVSAIQGQRSINNIARVLDDFFSRYAHQANQSGSLNVLEQVFDVLEAGSVRTMAAQVGLSERQLRRVTQDMTGLTPKQIHRILRMQQALHDLLHADSPLPEADYYDDSHRIRELKSLTGLTPGEIRRMAEIYNKPGRH